MKESNLSPFSGSRSDESLRVNGKSHQIFLERFVSIIPIPYYWGWAIFGGIIFLVTSFALIYFENSSSYIPSILILSI